MTSSSTLRAVTERLHCLATAGLDDETLRSEAIAALQRALPVDGWAWATSDPSSQLAATALSEHPLGPRMFALLQGEEDPDEVNRRSVLAASGTAAATLSATTGGKPHRSRRWREHLSDVGIGDELRIVFADRTGCWAYLDLYTYGGRCYDADDLVLARTTAQLLTAPLRRAPTPQRAGTDRLVIRDPAVLVVDRGLRVLARTGPADTWLPLLRTAPGDPLPCAVLAATARVLATRSEQAACVRQRDAEGRWATVRAARLDTGDVAVTVGSAAPGEVLGYTARAAALTRRERQLLDLLHQGHDTRGIATRLTIAETTVQDHVKHILRKTGYTSRRSLLSAMR